MDALNIAIENPGRQVAFLGIGFETTAPATAAVIKEAYEKNIKNFSVFSLHKRVEPVMRVLLESNEVKIHGFLLPGHVAVITGVKAFEFLKPYGVPGIVCGFEPVDILNAIYRLVAEIENKECEVQNEYIRAVKYEGNIEALNYIEDVFEECDDIWRGMGIIKGSGLKIRDKYREFDASYRYAIKFPSKLSVSPCRCGEVLRGIIEPEECCMFGTECLPESPVGPCMVSSEGSCSAAYKYR
jgi:hydrogenase expression/formation protein HypD